ncbi:DUF4336 domain-containing protein [Maricaulis maris]|uniref:Uncharacterized protein DUF4336 n=1 Tax=Maricaulis maris TaxID=74318 RepID=A0A495D213_9PROT|nr:DUF4336 domain-containing protein [Maricaulis maris]RKQ95592.1 uncharacterized protein DUF4336 [Maricaulis maris]
MAATTDNSTLRCLSDGIWTASGDVVTAAAGFHYPTRMVVIRLDDDRLWVWSPVALNEARKREIDALGLVAHIVAPNSLHHLALSDWQSAYPAARLHGAPGMAAQLPDLKFDTELTDTADPAWAGQIDQVVVPGNRITTEVVFYHRSSGTVIFTDLIQHLPDDWYSGWRSWVARWDRMTGPEPAVPGKFRLAFRDRKRARAAIDRIFAWPARTVLFAHGEPVRDDAQAFLTRAFAWLR